MRTLNFTYDVCFVGEEEFTQGETCMDITMEDSYAEKFLEGTARREDKVLVKSIIIANELLKGRSFVPDSIKSVRESK